MAVEVRSHRHLSAFPFGKGPGRGGWVGGSSRSALSYASAATHQCCTGGKAGFPFLRVELHNLPILHTSGSHRSQQLQAQIEPGLRSITTLIPLTLFLHLFYAVRDKSSNPFPRHHHHHLPPPPTPAELIFIISLSKTFRESDGSPLGLEVSGFWGRTHQQKSRMMGFSPRLI